MEKISFDGQAVVVTGAGSGLGRGYALEIARRGGSVVVNDLGGSVRGEGASSSLADAVVEEIRSAGGKAVANYSDVASAEGGQQMIAAALENFGRIDAVIANAGNFRMAKFDALSASDLMALLTVHAVGSWNVAQAAWPHMKEQGYFRDHFWTTFWFEKIGPQTQLDIIGADKVLFETDFPHPTSIYPDVQAAIVERLGDQPYEVRKKVLQDNAVKLFNLPF